MKPVISYYGGKQRMASKIVPLIPQHTVYVEPFCGGAAIFFAKPWPKVTNTDHYREVINDHDKRLINFYEQLRDNGQALVDALKLTLYCKHEYQIAKVRDCYDKLEAARRYYINVQQSFSNKLNGGWVRAVFKENVAATWAKKIAQLPDYLNRVQSVHIACDVALEPVWHAPRRGRHAG